MARRCRLLENSLVQMVHGESPDRRMFAQIDRCTYGTVTVHEEGERKGQVVVAKRKEKTEMIKQKLRLHNNKEWELE